MGGVRLLESETEIQTLNSTCSIKEVATFQELVLLLALRMASKLPDLWLVFEVKKKDSQIIDCPFLVDLPLGNIVGSPGYQRMCMIYC